MRVFTENDVDKMGDYHRIFAEQSDLVEDRPEWMKRGLQETASGYGSRLNSGLKINFEGRLYRIYVTIYGNSGSSWFKVRGRKIFVD